ncbi:hypothetical protein Q9L58_001802 [Maublancomyces gigas]|uniref:Nnf1 n=1 Tax=Discina gigas TaxID=1032678 RepID=A0ABR3GT71_9PEZI
MSNTIPENVPPNPTPDDGPGPLEKEKEVEGIRAAQLRKIFTIALSKSIKNCSYENFSRCFPTPARYAPGILRGAWQQMCEFWERLAKKEYEDILKERNVVQSLNQLDILTKEAEERRGEAPPGENPISYASSGSLGDEMLMNTRPSTLPPDVIITAQLTPLLVAAQQRLTSRISEVQSENAGLMSTIEDQRREIEQLLKVLESGLGHLEGAVEVVNTGRKLVMKDTGLSEEDQSERR